MSRLSFITFISNKELPIKYHSVYCRISLICTFFHILSLLHCKKKKKKKETTSDGNNIHHVAMFTAFPLMVLRGGIDPTPVAVSVCLFSLFCANGLKRNGLEMVNRLISDY